MAAIRLSSAEAVRRYAGSNTSAAVAIKTASTEGSILNSVARRIADRMQEIKSAEKIKCPSCQNFGAVKVKMSKFFPEEEAWFCQKCRASFLK